jgi:aspartate carbamoyltransferase catalytic subunit
MPGLLSAGDLDRGAIEELLARAGELRAGAAPSPRHGKVLAAYFAEPSLRTRVGFAAAAARLGATTVAVDAAKQSRQMTIPESFDDTLRSLAPHCDAILLRTGERGAAEQAAALVDPVPVVNCGDGGGEHPPQALADLFAIQSLRGSIDGVRIAIVGDLRHMRTAHSLLLALARFSGVTARCIAPQGLEMPEPFTTAFEAVGGLLEHRDALELGGVDFAYVAGLPRMDGSPATIADQDRLRIDPRAVAGLPSGARILCPLPRVDEIAPQVDATPHAAYFEQNALSAPLRVALLERVLS